MKKALRIIVPILLAITILAGIYWYLFIYDRAFTRDMLLNSARYFEHQGSHELAAWFYDLAYEQGGDSDEVALELAKQYVNSGSFTKAEKTLFRAIRDGGGAKVYMALSKVFVMQDKLIDAVDLLDNVQDASIKAELDAFRPSAPSPLQAPGLYNQYIDVNLTCEKGVIYANTDGEFPTISYDAYTAAIPLKDGENWIYTVAVTDDGLVSPLQIYSYTVGGIVAKMEFSDNAMETAIRAALNIPENKELYTNDLWNIKEFTIPAGAVNYADLKHMIFLERLIIHDGVRGQLSVLSELDALRTLQIKNTPISTDELGIIGALPNLESLTLDNCSLATSTPLKNAKLTYLNLSNNAIRNIQALGSMPLLKEVHLSRNALTDLSALSTCTNLTILDVSYNSLASLSPIINLNKLTWLNASGNMLSGLEGISQLTALSYLNVSDNAITTISELSDCSDLNKLYLSKNQLTDITPLAALLKLTHLDFSYNSVSKLPKWPMNCALITIDGSHNAIRDLSNLGGLNALNKVLMDYNENISSVNALADCPNLIQVNVFGTKVSDVTALTQHSIIVNYNPLND